MDRSEFEEDLEIDPNQLDVQAATQGDIYFKWAKRAVFAHKQMDRLKLKLDVLTSTLSNKIRLNPDTYGIDRVTEGAIDCAVKTSGEYLEIYEQVTESRYECSLLDKAVDALEQRKRMIECLITLHGQEYFAGPVTPRNLTKIWKDMKEHRTKSVIRKTKIRKRNKGKEA